MRKRNALLLAVVIVIATFGLSKWYPNLSVAASFGSVCGFAVFLYDRYRKFSQFRDYRGSVLIGVGLSSTVCGQIPLVWAQHVSLAAYGWRCLLVAIAAAYASAFHRILQMAFGERPPRHKSSEDAAGSHQANRAETSHDRSRKQRAQKSAMPEEKTSCKKCGVEILKRTAELHGDCCAPCSRGLLDDEYGPWLITIPTIGLIFGAYWIWPEWFVTHGGAISIVFRAALLLLTCVCCISAIRERNRIATMIWGIPALLLLISFLP